MILTREKSYEHLSLARKHVDKKTEQTHVLNMEAFDLVPKFQLSGTYVRKTLVWQFGSL